MDRTVTLAVDVDAPQERVFEILSTTDGQRAFWTADCDVSGDRARFGFAVAPVDLEVNVTTTPGVRVQMQVTSGFPFWVGSTWEWELGEIPETKDKTSVLFRHYGFEDGYGELDFAHTAESWALILERLARYITSGEEQPFFS